MQHLNTVQAEVSVYHPAIYPIDSQAGANNGLFVSLKGYAGCEVVLFKALGTAGDDPVFTVTQAQAVAGTGEKALNISRVDAKLSATTVPGLYTAATQTAGPTYTDDTSAEKRGFIVTDVKAEDLDVDNGFDCIRLKIPDTGAAGAQLLCGFYRLYGPRFAGAGLVSPIAD